jgi:uncharacterized protein YjbI with pentapeptide repeats
MANDDHIAQLMKGVKAWNAWRDENPTSSPDLNGEDLRKAKLRGADLSGANLSKANLMDANLSRVNLSSANLRGVDLLRANLSRVNLRGADLGLANLVSANLSGANLSKALLFGADLRKGDLSSADLSEADLREANLSKAILVSANLSRANLVSVNLSGALLIGANLSEADLRGADLGLANLVSANLSGASLFEASLGLADLSSAILMDANLSRANLFLASLALANLSDANLDAADLTGAILMDTNLASANLTGCRVYGVSAWGVKLDSVKQQNLIITPADEPEITVDNIEVAQFVHLLLHNEKIRHVIDTITSKVVLILGRFTDERKAVLDALREELRKRNYLPVLFDFEKPRSLTTDEKITLLARMARFVIADLTDAKSVLQELRGIVPDLPSVAILPLILTPQEEPGMFDFFRSYPWVLEPCRYGSQERLLANLEKFIVDPAEAKVLELRGAPRGAFSA